MHSSFGDLVKINREALGLTQDQAAKAIRERYGVRLSSAYLSMIERNERTNLTTNLDTALRDFFGIAKIQKSLESDSGNNLTGDQPSPNPLTILPVKQIPRLNSINTGDLIRAKEDFKDWLNIPENLDSDFALRANDDCMINANIFEGDIAICKWANNVEPGKIVVAILNGETSTIRYLVREEGVWKLRSANPDYPDHVLNEYKDKTVAVVTDILKNTSDLSKPDLKVSQINKLAAKLSPKKLSRLIALMEVMQDDDE